MQNIVSCGVLDTGDSVWYGLSSDTIHTMVTNVSLIIGGIKGGFQKCTFPNIFHPKRGSALTCEQEGLLRRYSHQWCYLTLPLIWHHTQPCSYRLAKYPPYHKRLSEYHFLCQLRNLPGASTQVIIRFTPNQKNWDMRFCQGTRCFNSKVWAFRQRPESAFSLATRGVLWFAL